MASMLTIHKSKRNCWRRRHNDAVNVKQLNDVKAASNTKSRR